MLGQKFKCKQFIWEEITGNTGRKGRQGSQKKNHYQEVISGVTGAWSHGWSLGNGILYKSQSCPIWGVRKLGYLYPSFHQTLAEGSSCIIVIVYQCKKKKSLNSYFTSCKQFNVRRIICLDVKDRTIKFSDENIGEYMYNLRVVRDFLGRTQKALKKKKKPEKLIKLTSFRIKYFCSLENIVKTRKRQVIEWEEYFQYIYLTINLYPVYIKNPLQISNDKDLNTYFMK